MLTGMHPMQGAWRAMHAWRGPGGPVPDPACCLCLADGWLLVARASGALQRFSLLGRELAGADFCPPCLTRRWGKGPGAAGHARGGGWQRSQPAGREPAGAGRGCASDESPATVV